jgi:hypothetical protein
MPRLKKAGYYYSILFSPIEANELGLKEGDFYEFFKAKEDIWVVQQRKGGPPPRPEKKEEPPKPIQIKNNPKNQQHPIQKDGFFVTTNQNEAKMFSEQFFKEFKEGELKGIKCFDGNYCVIKTSTLKSVSTEVINILAENGKMTSKEISDSLKKPLPLIRGIIEFQKEEGNILERRKNELELIS